MRSSRKPISRTGTDVSPTLGREGSCRPVVYRLTVSFMASVGILPSEIQRKRTSFSIDDEVEELVTGIVKVGMPPVTASEVTGSTVDQTELEPEGPRGRRFEPLNLDSIRLRDGV